MIMFSLVAMSAFLVIRGAHSIPVAVVTLSAILDTTVGAGAVRSYLLRVKIVLVVAGLHTMYCVSEHDGTVEATSTMSY